MVGAPSSLLGFLESFLSEWGFKPTPPFGERNSCLQEGHYLESVAPPTPPPPPEHHHIKNFYFKTPPNFLQNFL